MEDGFNLVYDVYLKDPHRLIMEDSNPNPSYYEWDTSIQVVAKNHSEVNDKIPEEYKNWYVIKIESPLDRKK